jgi:hypothetical protein
MIMVLTTPIHEATHWILSDIDPYVEPIEFHIFDEKSFQKNNNILSSALGYVVIKEKYPGAFNDRPLWMDLIQELICISIQIILTCIIVLKIFRFLMNKNFNLIKNIV